MIIFNNNNSSIIIHYAAPYPGVRVTGAALRKNEFLIPYKIQKHVINGSPRGRFEHLGVETG